MASLWFYKSGEKEVGPVAFQELVELLRAGKLTGDHRVRRELSPEWGAARDVIGLVRAALGQAGASASPAEGEKEKSPPAAVAKPAAGVSPPAPSRPRAVSAPEATTAHTAPAHPSARRRLTLLVGAAVLIALVAGYLVAGPEFSLARLFGKKATLREEFNGTAIDLPRWQVQQTGARVTPKDGELRAVFPPGRSRSSTVGLDSRFKIEGDFEIRVDYRLIAVESPKKANEEIKVDILVEGPDGKASVMRGIRLRNGDWYACWADRTADTPDAGVWNETETKDRSGSLCLRRSGEQLAFLVTGPDEELRELHSIPYGLAPIDKLWLRVWVPSNEKPVEIACDNLQIEANRLLMPSSNRSRFSWAVTSAAVALAMAAGAAWYWTSRR
jgi:hypothetical protein